MSQDTAPKNRSKIMPILCIILVVVSVLSIGYAAYQSSHPTTITLTQTTTSFQTATSISILMQTSTSYATVTTALGTTTALYGFAPCPGGYCQPYDSQFTNYCYSGTAVGVQCTLYGLVQVSSTGCILLSVASGYNNNIYYALTNWLSTYPTFGYISVNGYITGPSGNCSAIGFHVNSLNH